MDERQIQLLNLVVKNHIDTAEPIGSKFLVEQGSVDCGEATVRNDLRALEEAGYLTHPHTSAGRVPTEKGYKFYLESLDLKKTKISKKDNDVLGLSAQAVSAPELKQKNIAKSLAELSVETTLVAFSPERIYYTGLSNLFSKPEFRALELVTNLSEIFDHCEDCLKDFFDDVGAEPKFFIGNEHNFGQLLSVLAFRFGDDSLFALLGPMRMDYGRNWALVNRARELL